MYWPLSLFVGFCVGLIVAWLHCRSARAVLGERIEARDRQIREMEARIQETSGQTNMLRDESSTLKAREAELNTALEFERKAFDEKIALIEDARQKLSAAFGDLSAQALKSNNQAFIQLARETLEKYQVQKATLRIATCY